MKIKVLINILFSLLFFSFSYVHSVDASGATKIYAIGDSLTAEYQVKLVSLLGSSCKLVTSSSADSSCEVVNRGQGGFTTAQILARFQEEVLPKGDAAYVIVWGGINDIAPGGSAETVKNNLQSIYALAQNAGIKVVAINITPFKNNTNGAAYAWSEEKQAAVDAVNSWIAGQATGVDYRIDMRSLLEDSQNPNTLLPQYDYGDRLHLNLEGQYFVGSTLYSQVTWAGIGGECYPDLSCQADTCANNTCTEAACGWVLNGTKNCGTTPAPTAASFSASPASGVAPLDVNFTLANSVGCINYLCSPGVGTQDFIYEHSFNCHYPVAGNYTASIECGGSKIEKIVTVTEPEISLGSTPSCFASFSSAATTTGTSSLSLIAPGTAYLSFSSSGADNLIGSCSGPWPIPQNNYGLAYANFPFPFSATQTGTQTCTFVPFRGGAEGTSCSASVTVNADSSLSTTPAGRGSCVSNCTCAVDTPVGATCSDGCGGICKGTKSVCHPSNPVCAMHNCKDVYCFDGCERKRGTKDCRGME
jgi:lysophospholipase L1-like esterase